MDKWKIVAAAGGATACAAACAARSEYEKQHFEKVYYRLRTKKPGPAWDGTKAVFLTDLHENCFGYDNWPLVDAIAEEKPEFVLIGGDMLIAKEWKSMDFSLLESLFSRLARRWPVYYALGNHEQRLKEEANRYPGWWEAYMHMLHDCGIELLINKSVMLEKSGQSICIGGITLKKGCYGKLRHTDFSCTDMDKRLRRVPEGCYGILLAHSPMFIDTYAEWGADLVLSGHFHGGTIRIPGLGGVMTPQMQFFSPLARGLVTRGDTKMIVSGGLGTHSINIRLNNRPQLVVLCWSTK